MALPLALDPRPRRRRPAPALVIACLALSKVRDISGRNGRSLLFGFSKEASNLPFPRRWFLSLTLHLTCKLSFKGRPTFNMQYGLKKIWQLLTSIYKWTCVIDFHLLSVKSLTLLWVNLPRMSVSFVTVVWSFFNVLSVKKMSEGCVKNHVWSSKKWPWRTHARGY